MTETLLKFLNPQYVIIIGALISVCGGYLASAKTDIESRKTGDKMNLISQVSTETNKEITATDSYCSIIINFNNLNEPKFFLNHVGETKLENVSITIWDSEKIKKLNQLAISDGEAFFKEYKKCSNKFDFEIIHPNTSYQNIPIDLDENENNIDLVVEIHFGSRILRQTINVEKYKSSDRIIKNKIEENGKLIAQSQVSK
jgi:hypothetical protein